MLRRLVPCLLLLLTGILSAQETPAVPLPEGVKELHAPGIHNFFQLTPGIYSGSGPEGDEAFEALKKLGIKTIVTVDGAKPDVEAARRYGLRYVHLPHGYDGIPATTAQQLAKSAAELPGPIFVHCHHGKHRGPAAAAVMCETVAQWTPEKSAQWLKAAGTSPSYAGLYDSVRDFRPPTKEQLAALPAKFPETTEVSTLVDSMVAIDEVWDRLKAAQKSGAPASASARDAVLLWEHYREVQRLPECDRQTSAFREKLQSAETNAATLRTRAEAIPPVSRADFDAAFQAAAQNCVDCHKAHRDPAKHHAR